MLMHSVKLFKIRLKIMRIIGMIFLLITGKEEKNFVIYQSYDRD